MIVALPNRAPLLLEENHDLPLSRFQITFRTGAADDPEDHQGLACFASDLARRGAGEKSRREIDLAIEELGGELSVSTDGDSTTFDVEVLSRHLDRATQILAEVVLRSDLPAAEAAQLRRESKATLDELRDDDGSLARRFFSRQLFGGTPYGHTVIGTADSLDRLDEERARGWLERTICAGNAVFGASGDLDEARAAQLVARRFGVLRAGGPPAIALPAAPLPSGLRLQIVDKPGRTQTQILMGQPAPRWADPDFLPLAIGVTAFGGTFTARLMTEIRVKRGLSYGAYARLGQSRGPRAITVSAAPSLSQTVETLELLLELFAGFAGGDLREDEIEFAREHTAGAFGFQIATPEDRLDLAVSGLLCDLPADYRETKVARTRAVTAAEVKRAIARHLRPHDLAITVVATASKLRPLLARSKRLRFDEVTVVPFDSY